MVEAPEPMLFDQKKPFVGSHQRCFTNVLPHSCLISLAFDRVRQQHLVFYLGGFGGSKGRHGQVASGRI